MYKVIESIIYIGISIYIYWFKVYSPKRTAAVTVLTNPLLCMWSWRSCQIWNDIFFSPSFLSISFVLNSQYSQNYMLYLFHKNKTSLMEAMTLTISEAIILTFITEVLWGSQEVFFYGWDGAIGVVIDPLTCCSALLKLSFFSPLQPNEELVYIKDDAAWLSGASLVWTLDQTHTCTSLLLLSTLNETGTESY